MSSSCTASQQITLAAFRQYILPQSDQDRLERRVESQPLHTGDCSMSLEEAPSPPLSPTSVTPTIECISWDQTPQRQRSHSAPLSQQQVSFAVAALDRKQMMQSLLLLLSKCMFLCIIYVKYLIIMLEGLCIH